MPGRSGFAEASQQLAETFREWRSARRRLKKLSEEGSEVEAKRQLLRYQVEELDQLGLAEGELQTLEEEQHTLAHAEETERLMGRDFWPYGYEPNVRALETFLRYSFEQGLSKRLLQPKELFAPESLESFKI